MVNSLYGVQIGNGIANRLWKSSWADEPAEDWVGQ